ncbi:MAG TPA: hypothetical protein VGQ83_02200 [Polyangia bacterium]
MRTCILISLLVLPLAGCPRDRGAEPAPPSAAPAPAAAPPAAAAAAPPAAAVTAADPALGGLRPRTDLPPERRAIIAAGGAEHVVDADEARAAGRTLVDLRDDWTPYIFNDLTAADGRPLPNRYRTIFLGLANDRTDADGQPLARGGAAGRPGAAEPAAAHFLEVYGIPPSLGVLRARFLADAPDATGRDRCSHVDRPSLRPLAAGALEGKRRSATDQSALAAVEARLACEGLLPHAGHRAGAWDEGLRQAVLRFQRKHKIYQGPSAIRGETLAALRRTLVENDHAALVRVLTERAVAAADVLEDGSVDRPGAKGAAPTAPTWRAADGTQLAVRNLVDEVSRATLEQLGLTTPAAALAFFQRHPAADFAWLRAAVRMPPPPEYHSKEMALEVEIDRGDVSYDPPFNARGKRVYPSRTRHPQLTLFTRYRGQQIPLVKWRTTIGGWRTELAANGYEYYRYKGSDVGERVWRHVVAAPVWVAPTSTPLRALVKGKNVNGVWQTVVNYDEVGPGYLSAYGLVAAYNIVPGKGGKPDWDNGVRVHGSSEYRSIFDPAGYSHGCHRLVNHLAVRLFSFVLRHRRMTVDGEQNFGFSRDFLYKDHVYVLRLPTRGYRFALDPPLPVHVLEGNIAGKVQQPIEGLVRIPGTRYPPGDVPSTSDKPEERAGAAAGGDAEEEE